MLLLTVSRLETKLMKSSKIYFNYNFIGCIHRQLRRIQLCGVAVVGVATSRANCIGLTRCLGRLFHSLVYLKTATYLS
jgi:hypothetical protein